MNPPSSTQQPRHLAGAAATAAETPREEIARLIRSRFPIVYLETVEELRAETIVVAAARACGRQCFTWSVSSGLVRVGDDNPAKPTTEPQVALQRIAEITADSVFIMRDLARHVESDPVAERLLRDIARAGHATLVLLGPHGPIPEAIRPSAATYALPRPDIHLIEQHVRTAVAHAVRAHGIDNQLDPAGITRLAGGLRGLTLDEVDQVLLHLLHRDARLDANDVTDAVKEKGRLLARGGTLTLESPVHGLEWVAGFDGLKAWVASRARAFEPDAVAFGLTPPRGVLLTGVPGCGKSFVAKAIAHDWNMPLLRLDAGSLYDSFVGASERNLREALATAGALAPSVLWIDEIEKGFGSRGPSESDGGLSYRMLGTLATWMQERPHPVFLIATSNDILKLPPELTRQGRFDETFFVDLPDAAARTHLFMLQLARRGRRHELFDCAALAAASEGFSGAEIEQTVTSALYAAFAAGRDIVTADVAAELARTRPLSVVNPAAIDQIRVWGAAHARPA